MSLKEMFHLGKTKDNEVVSDLRTRVDNVFDDWFNDFSLFKPELTRFNPTVNFVENDKGYTLKAEMPGLTKDDINVEVEDGVLVLSGVKKEEKVSDKDKVHTRECSYGKFIRSFRLPENADSESIIAEYDNGVLTLTMAKNTQSLENKKVIKVK